MHSSGKKSEPLRSTRYVRAGRCTSAADLFWTIAPHLGSAGLGANGITHAQAKLLADPEKARLQLSLPFRGGLLTSRRLRKRSQSRVRKVVAQNIAEARSAGRHRFRPALAQSDSVALPAAFENH